MFGESVETLRELCKPCSAEKFLASSSISQLVGLGHSCLGLCPPEMSTDPHRGPVQSHFSVLLSSVVFVSGKRSVMFYNVRNGSVESVIFFVFKTLHIIFTWLLARFSAGKVHPKLSPQF